MQYQFRETGTYKRKPTLAPRGSSLQKAATAVVLGGFSTVSSFRNNRARTSVMLPETHMGLASNPQGVGHLLSWPHPGGRWSGLAGISRNLLIIKYYRKPRVLRSSILQSWLSQEQPCLICVKITLENQFTKPAYISHLTEGSLSSGRSNNSMADGSLCLSLI